MKNDKKNKNTVTVKVIVILIVIAKVIIGDPDTYNHKIVKCITLFMMIVVTIDYNIVGIVNNGLELNDSLYILLREAVPFCHCSSSFLSFFTFIVIIFQIVTVIIFIVIVIIFHCHCYDWWLLLLSLCIVIAIHLLYCSW